MSLTAVHVNLYRDGANTAWGFRLQGGTDIGLPLSIQRVFYGSPADGELQRSDIITKINNKDATRMTHQQAHNAIKSVGNNLSLVVHRTGHHHHNTPALNSHYYATLPRTDFNGDTRRHFTPFSPQNSPAALNSDIESEKEFERQCITNQPHRTFPLVTPGVKVKHDVPTGSYLRHAHDPFTRSRPETNMKSKVHETVLNAAWSAGSSPARSATPEVTGTAPPNPIYHRQYNSPINLYSPQNVADIIAGQTGVSPTLGDVIKEAILEIATPPPTSGDDRTSSVLRSRFGEVRYYDVTKSPTYQAIYEEEWRKGRTTDQLAEHKPVQNKVKIVVPPSPPKYQHYDDVNPLGVPRDKVLQSKSFEMLKTVLTGETDF